MDGKTWLYALGLRAARRCEDPWLPPSPVVDTDAVAALLAEIEYLEGKVKYLQTKLGRRSPWRLS